jgi:hypothetical protein
MGFDKSIEGSYITTANLFTYTSYHIENYKIFLKKPHTLLIILLAITFVRFIFYALIKIIITLIIIFIFIFFTEGVLKNNSVFPFNLQPNHKVNIITLPIVLVTYIVCYSWVNAYNIYIYNIKLLKLRNIIDLIVFIVIGITPFIIRYVLDIYNIAETILNSKINKKKKYVLYVHTKWLYIQVCDEVINSYYIGFCRTAIINNQNNTFNPKEPWNGLQHIGKLSLTKFNEVGNYHVMLGNNTFTSKPIKESLVNIPVYSKIKTTFLTLGVMSTNPYDSIEITGSMSNKLCLGISGYKNELTYIATLSTDHDVKLCLTQPAQIQTTINHKSVVKSFFGKDKFKKAKDFLEKNNILDSDNNNYLTDLDKTYSSITEEGSDFIAQNISKYALKNLYRLNNELLIYKIEQDGSITEVYKTPQQVHYKCTHKLNDLTIKAFIMDGAEVFDLYNNKM